MDAPWRIDLLGCLRASRGDHAIFRFRSRSIGALLGFLALHLHRPHSRVTLIEQFWPEREPRTGRANLRVALCHLRRHLRLAEGGQDPIIANHATVQLNPRVVATDVAQFEAALRAAAPAGCSLQRERHLEEAVSLYRGELLSGCFDDWVLSERQRLSEAHLRALGQLAALREQASDLFGAIAWARRLLAADPLRAETHKELIRLLIATGQSETVRQEYGRLWHLVDDLLGTNPTPETRALLLSIRSNAPHQLGMDNGVTGGDGDPRDRTADRRAWARELSRRSIAARHRGDTAQERALCEQSLGLFRELGEELRVAAQLRNLGRAMGRQGQWEAARYRFEECLAIRCRLNHRPGMAQALCDLATVSKRQRELLLASRLYEQSLAIYQELGDTPLVATLLTYLGATALGQGDYSVARAYYSRSLTEWQQLGDSVGVARALKGLLAAAKRCADQALASPNRADNPDVHGGETMS